MIEKIEKHFNLRGIDKVKRTPDGHPDEFTIYEIDKTTNIEVVTRAVAITNELDFINDIQERNEFLKDMAQATDPEEIGAYTRIETNLYYKEF